MSGIVIEPDGRVSPDPPVVGDAFGQMLLACRQAGAVPGQVFEIVERDDGLITAADAARYFANPKDWAPGERELLAGIRGRVLDIGCGAGRHAVFLRRSGVEVLGPEPSAGAQVAGTAECRSCRPVRTPAGLGVFEEFLLLGNNLGLLADAVTAARVLSVLAEIAAPGADPREGLDPHHQNPLHVAYHARNRPLGRLPGQVRIRVRHDNLATEFFDYLFVSPEELAGLLVATPWRIERVHEHPEGRYHVELRLEN